MVRLLVAGVLLAGLGQAQIASPEAALQQAVQLQQAGDLNGAVALYRQFLAAHPGEAAVRSNLGVLLAHLGRYEEAIAEYGKAGELDPDNAGIELNLGLAYYKSGRIPEAVPAFARALQLSPDSSQTALLLGDCYLRLGKNQKVIELLRAGEQRSPTDLAIAYLMGMALLRDGQIREGQARVDKILGNGDSAEARFLLGMQRFAAGDFPAAVKQLAGAAELNPRLPDLEASYGRALLNTGDAEAAAAAFRKELEADPNHFEANLYLGQILGARQNWSEVEPLAERALTVRPDSLPAKLLAGDAQMGEGHSLQAQKILEQAEKDWPQSPAVHQRLLRVYQTRHSAGAAREQRQILRGLEPAEPRPQPAPEFSALKYRSGEKLSLAGLRKAGPVLLVFGSYTCPNFRAAAAALNRFYSRYGGEVPFYLIYIREAHSTADWVSTENQRAGVVLPPAANLTEQQEHATMCVRKLHIDFPALLDGMDGAAAKAYSAWPSKAVLVDSKGRIAFATGLGEQDFEAQRLEAALKQASALIAESGRAR